MVKEAEKFAEVDDKVSGIIDVTEKLLTSIDEGSRKMNS